jgi:hypothetical protein
MKNRFLLLSLIMIPFYTSAQTSFAPVLGFNVSKYKVEDGADARARLGLRAGVIANTPISDHLYVQPGIYYVMNGFRIDIPGIPEAASLNVNTLEIPINVTVKSDKPGNGRFFLSAGPYVGINLSGRASYPAVDMLGSYLYSVNVPVEIGMERDSEFGRLDFGVNANAGMEWPNGFFIRAYYQRGILPIQSIYSSNYGVSFGYLISNRTKAESKKPS